MCINKQTLEQTAITYTEKDLSQVTHDLHVTDEVGITAVRDDDLGTHASQVSDNVLSEITGRAENGDNQAIKGGTATSTTF